MKIVLETIIIMDGSQQYLWVKSLMKKVRSTVSNNIRRQVWKVSIIKIKTQKRVTDISRLHWCYWCVPYLGNTRAPGSGYDSASPTGLVVTLASPRAC